MISKNCVYYMVDKRHPLPSDYSPDDLVVAPIPFVASRDDPRCLIRSTMFFPLRSLYFAARDVGLRLYGVCAYRSFTQQQELYEKNVCSMGLDYTSRFIAPPGTSEHQTGLAIDLSCAANNFELNENFAYTPEGIWLQEHARQYGFTFSYPEHTWMLSGYCYEPWHIRYTCKSQQFYGMMDYI